MQKRYYKHIKKDIQHQIDTLLHVYNFLVSQNRKKDLPTTEVKQTSTKKGGQHEKVQ